jgi:hypothetical protein
MVSNGRTMNWVGCGRNRLWPSLRFKPRREQNTKNSVTTRIWTTLPWLSVALKTYIYIINILRHHVQQRNTCSNQLVSWNGEVCILMMDTVYFNKLLIRTGDLYRSGSCTRSGAWGINSPPPMQTTDGATVRRVRPFEAACWLAAVMPLLLLWDNARTVTPVRTMRK